jgi:hypothetical protein
MSPIIPTKSSPKISIVVTARNDDYGGNWVNRINAFIKVLVYQTNRLSFPCELVFVEYNPVPDKQNLYKELTVENNKFLNVRFIVVPNDFHKTLPNSDQVTVCEFIAKNIGIRRAHSEYIVASNPDTLWSNELFDFLASDKLKEDTYYRINRQDLSISYIEPNLSAEQILRLARKKVIKILYNNQSVYVSYREWLHIFIHGRSWKNFTQCPLFNELKTVDSDNTTIHENAAGDFLLMHHTLWKKVRGYDEMTVGSGIMDGYIMYMLYCLGTKQTIIPHALYHIYHHHKGVRYLASYEKFRKDAEDMLKTKKPYKEYSPAWGHPDTQFKEVIL